MVERQRGQQVGRTWVLAHIGHGDAPVLRVLGFLLAGQGLQVKVFVVVGSGVELAGQGRLQHLQVNCFQVIAVALPGLQIDHHRAAAISALITSRMLGLPFAVVSATWAMPASVPKAGSHRPTPAFSLGPRNDSQITTTARANYDGNHSYADSPKGEYREATPPVQSFEPNAWGLYSMHGHGWEFVQDAWVGHYPPIPVDGFAHGRMDDEDCAGVVRGGAWINRPSRLNSATRNKNSPDRRRNKRGFRLASTPSTPGMASAAAPRSAATFWAGPRPPPAPHPKPAPPCPASGTASWV